MLQNGEPIPPLGTPYAPEPHTRIHIEFLKSEVGKQLSDDQMQKMMQHVTGEIEAIKQREGGGGPQAANAQPQGPAMAQAGGVGQGGQNITPAKIEGGNQVPTGRALGNG
jgi:hypothetical protein